MLSLSANPDFSTLETATTVNQYYDIDSRGEKTELWGKEAIDQMIENVIMTEPFERLFNLSYGSPLYLVLFDNFSNLDSIMSEVFDTIEYWVPIKIDRAKADIETDEINHVLMFKIPYVSNNGMISGLFARRIRK